MLVYNGKENYAKVFIDIIDEATVSQIFEFINHPALKGTKIRIMPDCHAGKGCVVGTTIDLKNCNYIIPNMVGVDIGCGIISYNLGKEAGDKLKNDEDFKAFYDFLKVTIPTGFNVHKDMKYIDKDRYSQIEKNGIEKVCDKIDYDFNRAKLSIGTLGGGNHFIELNKDDEDNIWLTIHTGSRGFGESVCRYHQKKAEGLIKDMYFGASAYKGAEFLLLNNGGNEYLKDMKVAQYYASLNRYVIAELILPYFNITVDKYYTFKPKVNFVESVHNYIEIGRAHV